MTFASTAGAFNDKIGLADLETPIPEGIPQPPLWRIFAIPVRLRKVSAGGIILTDDSIDAMEWQHQLYKIAAVGPQVYQGPAYKHFEISEDEIPKAGDLWLIDPKQPRRFVFKDLTVIVVNDDQLLARVDPASVPHLKMSGVSL